MKAVRSGWQGAILVCGKCSKKIDGGFGKKGKTPLAKALRKLLALGKGRRAALGIVETRCLGVCPKNAVIAVDLRDPQRWLVVPKGDDLIALAAFGTATERVV
jgi:predicted metal-binding protein